MSQPEATKRADPKRWMPEEFVKQWAVRDSPSHPSLPLDRDDLEQSIKCAFVLKDNDTYVYHAMASVTLHQVQQAIQVGNKHGMHAWYQDGDGKQARGLLPAIRAPPVADIDAYTSIFSSTTSTASALKGLASNAKKDSLRASIATNLNDQRLFPDTVLKIPKKKPGNAHVNPYLDYWTWSCRALEWAGPDASTVNVKISHHILPIFYHHFGCVCPTYESLETIRQFCQRPDLLSLSESTVPAVSSTTSPPSQPQADPATTTASQKAKPKSKPKEKEPPKDVIELGSGNGYWTFLLRQLGLRVHAVDNGDSLWRTMWINDTLKCDGATYLTRRDVAGGADAVLLLVYPQTTTSFTRAVLAAYRGDVICVAGTQNANGFTAFRDKTVDVYMREAHPEFEKVVQTPLPSFAGKDEAFFVFRRRRDAV